MTLAIGTKVWANPIGNIGGTTKGVVVGFNAYDHVLIQNDATGHTEE